MDDTKCQNKKVLLARLKKHIVASMQQLDDQVIIDRLSFLPSGLDQFMAQPWSLDDCVTVVELLQLPVAFEVSTAHLSFSLRYEG